MPKENIDRLMKHEGVSPLTHPWGIHTSDASPLSAVSLFSWFESEEELRTSLAESTWSPSVLEARQQDLIGRLADEWDLVDQDG